MGWIVDHIGLIVFLVIAIAFARKVRAVLKQAEEQANRRGGNRPMANVDPGEADRVRKIQEEIRRKIAERRGGAGAGEFSVPRPAAETTERPPLLQPQRTPPLDPFGGPMKRILTELERRANERTEPPLVRDAAGEEAEVQLQRQRDLAKRLRAAQEAREAAQKSEPVAAFHHTAPMKSVEAPAPGVARSELLTDLHDPRRLRRAFVLREVLGAPVGLR